MLKLLNKDGQTLLPTNRHGKIQHLLKDGNAKVVSRCPFTIKLLYDINGKKIDFSDMKKEFKTPKLCNCKRISARNYWMIDALAI